MAIMLLAKAIAFDAYGTLCYIGSQIDPYRKLLNSSSIPPAILRHELMTKSKSLKEFASKLDINEFELAEVENLIQQEVKSVRLYPEVLVVLQVLKMKGFKLAIVSNLAPPYAEPIRRHFSTIVDQMIFSFEVGAIKPESKIYRVLCEQLTTPPELVVMIGDSLKSDIQGAHKFGMQAIHLDRTLSQKQAKKKENCISDIGMMPNLVKRLK